MKMEPQSLAQRDVNVSPFFLSLFLNLCVLHSCFIILFLFNFCVCVCCFFSSRFLFALQIGQTNSEKEGERKKMESAHRPREKLNAVQDIHSPQKPKSRRRRERKTGMEKNKDWLSAFSSLIFHYYLIVGHIRSPRMMYHLITSSWVKQPIDIQHHSTLQNS